MRTCERCGAWLEPTAIDRSTDPAQFVCPVCGHQETLVRYPLWWIAGSSSAGKSALPEYALFEGEAIDFWRFADADGGYAALYDQWRKVAYEIARRAPGRLRRHAYPAQLARCPFGHYFAPLHYLGLVCSEAAQRERLLARPAWRAAGAPEFIARSCSFTRGLERLAAEEPDAVTLHDTTAHTPDESAMMIAAWVRRTGARTP